MQKGVSDLLIVRKSKSIFPMRKVPSLYQEENHILIKENWEWCQNGSAQTNLKSPLLFSDSFMSNSLQSNGLHAACQASLSCISWSLLTLMSIKSVMSSNHLILCRPLLLLPSVFLSIRIFSSKLALPTRWPKYWSFSISPLIFHSFSPYIS